MDLPTKIDRAYLMNVSERPQPTATEGASAVATGRIRARAVVHVDLDGARHIYQSHGWTYDYADDPLFVSGFRNLLSFLDRNRIRATMFAIAGDLEDGEKRECLEEAVRRGHEIASHTVTHPRLRQLGEEDKRREIAESREKLQSALRVDVRGFRAPGYDIDRECLELLDVYGYRYDSSVFPTADFAKRLSVPTVFNYPYRPLYDSGLFELPLPGHKPAPFPFHPSYSLLLGDAYFAWGLRRCVASGEPLIHLLHLTDFADPLPRERLRGLRSKMYTLSHLAARTKITRCQRMIDRVRKHYDFTETASLLDQASERKRISTPRILAISTTHETGSAIFEGPTLKAAISEERLDRVKFSTQYPPVRSMREAARVGGVDLRQVTDVVIAGLPFRQLIGRILKGQLKDIFEFHGFVDYFPHMCKALYRLFYVYRAAQYGSVRRHLWKNYGIRPRLHFVEHHQCHASAAYRTAPFDDALIVTADGVGDDVSITISTGRGGRIERLTEIRYPHSFGQFYTACTQVLGFRGGRHEGKITGLSGFGKVTPDLYQRVRATIRRSGPNFALDKRYYSEGIIRGFSLRQIRSGESLFDALQYRNYKTALKRLVANEPRENVAAVFQQILEEELEAVVRPYAEQAGLKNLALCGGIFANVKANDDLFRRLKMERVFIFPHMGDGGLSVGAALELLQTKPKPFDDVYWGPEYSEAEMESALRAAWDKGLRFHRDDTIERTVAERLVDGKVVARFNGRMEFGPRALGNRSILYRASDPSANKWLNDRLRRTEFMPFAPIVMTERAGELFHEMEGTEHACKFMTIILKCTEFTKEKCPAIVHVDGTARPQCVTEEINPSMYRILAHYESMTGVPVLVNTSYNMHEEPIVCTPEDAVRAYLASRLDFLAMGPFLAWLDS